MKRLKIAICQEVFGKIPFSIACQMAIEFGYRGMEIAPFIVHYDITRMQKSDLREMKRTSRQWGIELVAMHWLLSSPPGMSITTPNNAVFEKTRRFFKRLIDIAGILEIPVLVFGSPKQRNISDEWNFKSSYQRGIGFLSEMATMAWEKNLLLAFEPLGANVTNFGATITETLEIIKRINNPGLKVQLDVKAMHEDPELTPVQQIYLAGESIVHFHANDPNMLGPGMGDVDFKPLVKALNDVGYTGWYSVETFRQDVHPEGIARTSFDYLKKVLQDA
ncbi:MAG: sugar phosphate isomerase/epimerase family protein [Promethearchaeota archaeon]